MKHLITLAAIIALCGCGAESSSGGTQEQPAQAPELVIWWHHWPHTVTEYAAKPTDTIRIRNLGAIQTEPVMMTLSVTVDGQLYGTVTTDIPAIQPGEIHRVTINLAHEGGWTAPGMYRCTISIQGYGDPQASVLIDATGIPPEGAA